MPAPIQPGVQYTVAELKAAAGSTARLLRDYLQRSEYLRAYFAAQPDADLISLGLTQAEVDVLKGAYIGDLPAVKTLFDGKLFVPRLYGLGV